MRGEAGKARTMKAQQLRRRWEEEGEDEDEERGIAASTMGGLCCSCSSSPSTFSFSFAVVNALGKPVLFGLFAVVCPGKGRRWGPFLIEN